MHPFSPGCYVIYNFNQDEEKFYDATEELLQQTFAYYLGNEEQRLALSGIFESIAQKIVSAVDPSNAPYFAKSLYGIDASGKVLQWVNENLKNIEEYSYDDILTSIVNLFVDIFPGKIKIEIELLRDILQLWINGMPYKEIYRCTGEELAIKQIEKICANTLSFHLCFLIGNILDAIGDRSEYLTVQLAVLQKYIKYGVSSNFQVFICENIFDDRLIAKKLSAIFEKGYDPDLNFREYISARRRDILKTLKNYPEYFSYKLQMYTQKNAN